MTEALPYRDFPEPDSISEHFYVYEVDATQDRVIYYGEPMGSEEEVLRRIVPVFREMGYRVNMTSQKGEHVLVATERQTSVQGIPWKNVVLLVATIATTLFAGSRWYGIDVLSSPSGILRAWPFTASVLGVLAVHELGHYAVSRYHGVQSSLPYFIPIPNLIGTFGAVISINDNMPSRRALFDIGAAGPLAGLGATVIVTAIGVSLPPIEGGGSAFIARMELGYPVLIQGIAVLLGRPLEYGAGQMVNPVVIGGWVGAFVTFLNLLPVGQLDGAHMARAVLNDRMRHIEKAVPVFLFGLAGYLLVFQGGQSAFLWGFWGVLAVVFSRIGKVVPVDKAPVGDRRKVIAAVTLLLGVLCFTPVPIAVTA